ncbi:hypothetical protein L3Q82_013536, partial [Scortum barcoo]
MGELPPATTSSSLTLSHLRLGRLGHTRGLYMDCCINGTQCRALVDTGSTISLIRPGTLPGTAVSKPRGWKATKLRITTVTGERARMLGKRSLPVTVAKRWVGHEFWLANIQDSCIIGLDLLSKLRAVVDVPGATLYLDGEAVALHSAGEEGLRLISLPLKSPAGANDAMVSPSGGFALAVPSQEPAALLPQSAGPSMPLPATEMTFPPAQPPSMETKQAIDDLYDRSCEGLEVGQRLQLRELLDLFSDIFAAKDEDCTHTSLVQHNIDTGNAHPIRLHPRRLPLTKRALAEQKIKEMVEAGIIEPSTSPWAAPVVLVKKKDDTWRFCVDRVAIGKWSWHQKHAQRLPSPLAKDCGSLKLCPLASAMPQPPLSALWRGSWLTSPEIAASCTLDDLLAHAADFDSALANLRDVFFAIRKAGLRLHPRKCHLFRRETSFLGHVVSAAGVSTDPAKVTAVRNWPVPRNIGELRSFLGLASYYRRFVRDFATTASPLHRLTQKGQVFQWDPCRPFIVDTDASNVGLGAVLSQEGEQGEQVIAYFSRSLSRPERNYCVTRRELLAVILSLCHFRPYLYGQRFLLRSCTQTMPHSLGSLTLRNQRGSWPGGWRRYKITTLRYRHRAGRLHVNADALSRWPCEGDDCKYCQRMEDQDTAALRVAALRETPVVDDGRPPDSSSGGPQTSPMDLNHCFESIDPEQLRHDQSQDPVLSRVHELVGAGQRPKWPAVSALDTEVNAFYSQWSSLVSCGGLLHRSWQTPGAVPGGGSHGTSGCGYPGPFSRHRTGGNRYILVAMDYFTKWPEAYAVPDQSAATTAEHLVNEMFCRFGVPEERHSEQGRNFEAQVFAETCRRLGIKKTRTTPLHPQSDGLVERFNHTLATQLAILTNRKQLDWDLHLPLVLWAYWMAVQESTRCTPAVLMFGHELRTPVDLIFGPPPEPEVEGEPDLEYLYHLRERLNEVHNLTRQTLAAAGVRQKRAYDSV